LSYRRSFRTTRSSVAISLTIWSRSSISIRWWGERSRPWKSEDCSTTRSSC
jgi:hypothetical protein